MSTIEKPNTLEEIPVETPEQVLQRKQKVQAEKERRISNKERLSALGYSDSETYSISNNGYILPEIYSNEDPSVAALESLVMTENQHNATREAKGEDINTAPESYQQNRQSLIDHYTNDIGTYSPEEIERIVSIGHSSPDAFNPHLAADMLADRLIAEAGGELTPQLAEVGK